MYVIQLEKVNGNETTQELIKEQENNFSLLDKIMLVDFWDDKDVIGMGFSSAENLEGTNFDDEINKIHNAIISLGGKVDKLGNITFTQDFFINYFDSNYEQLKSFIEGLSFEDFTKIDFSSKLNKYKNKELFNDILIYSNSLKIAESDFDAIVRSRFIPSNENQENIDLFIDRGIFRIIFICEGEYKYLN